LARAKGKPEKGLRPLFARPFSPVPFSPVPFSPDKLDELGLARDTMVIFTSEHGETFGKRAGHPH
jgi:hypothetical protein